eukprot:CAMPEP_0115835830 /NCGR_PEP_ID=MMETSP0287-20121206/4395_1 /TAXON_ID=412157 /ORGANISM="Chrysochromulina rotalis, Strain UIO044" /LENGTH=43 /DNA_ID= /DNA_START= /DNA_END= /DNA_ORIENTATION=
MSRSPVDYVQARVCADNVAHGADIKSECSLFERLLHLARSKSA